MILFGTLQHAALSGSFRFQMIPLYHDSTKLATEAYQKDKIINENLLSDSSQES